MGGRGGGGPRAASISETGIPGPVMSPIEAAIRKAHSRLAQDPKTSVSLGDMRALMPNLSRAEVDRVLLDLDSRRIIRLIPEAKQSLLSPSDWAGAINIGGEAKHLIEFTGRS